MKKIAVVQFNEKQTNEQLLGIADWYIFSESADKDFEIVELKKFYEIVLEVK